MKPTFLITILIAVATGAAAQKMEFSFQANTGLFNFTGKSPNASSYIAQGYNGNDNITGNPYGTAPTFSYGISAQAKWVSKGGFIGGLQAGYEILRSNVNITTVRPAVFYLTGFYYVYFLPAEDKASGSSSLDNGYINLNPFIGYRLRCRNSEFDLLAGIDIGINTSSKENGKAIDANDNMSYTVNFSQSKLPADTRLRGGIAFNYNHFIINGSYAHGLTNLGKNRFNDNYNNAYSSLIRLGVGYRL